MNRIDSHQHFWNYHPAKQVWMSDAMSALKYDFGPADLLPLLNSCNLQGCVAVQANQAEEENDFLIQLSQQFSFIKGIVGWVDLQATNVKERLAYYQNIKIIKGFRHVIHDEVDIDFMLQPAFLNGINCLHEFDFTFDVLIFPIHLKNTFLLIKQNPQQRFVIDHIAKPAIKNNEFEIWKTNLAKVAALPNVYCKISGMVTEANWKQWKKEDFKIYLDTVFELFGTDRIMYGSDWPVCTLSANYTSMYEIVQDYFSKFSSNEQHKFFGLNATHFYHL